MINFLFFILLLIVFFVFSGISLIRWLLSRIFGKKNTQSDSHNSQQNHQHSTKEQQKSPNQKKIIDADEGEYIEYEEIKD